MTSTCIYHIFTNAAELCSKAVSVSIYCSDHNIVAIRRKAKVPKVGPKVIYKRSYKIFSQVSFVEDVKHVFLSDVYVEVKPDATLEIFVKCFMPIVNKLLRN